MGQHVDQPAERIAQEEAPDTPGLVYRTICDRMTSDTRPIEHRVEIVDLDREIGTGAPEPPSLAKLNCGAPDTTSAA